MLDRTSAEVLPLSFFLGAGAPSLILGCRLLHVRSCSTLLTVPCYILVAVASAAFRVLALILGANIAEFYPPSCVLSGC